MQLDQPPIIIECAQGTSEWFDARAGALTASDFKHFRASALTTRKVGDKPAGSYSATAEKIIRRRAFERLARRAIRDEQFLGYDARRGHELEPEARELFERRTGAMVDPAGFVLTADRRFGASADGFVGDDEGCEFKAFTNADTMLAIYDEDDLETAMDQVQGGMWITGRKVWHFGLYCPFLADCGMDLYVRTVPRDDDYINALEADLVKADRAVEALVAKLKNNPLYRAPA